MKSAPIEHIESMRREFEDMSLNVLAWITGKTGWKLEEYILMAKFVVSQYHNVKDVEIEQNSLGSRPREGCPQRKRVPDSLIALFGNSRPQECCCGFD